MIDAAREMSVGCPVSFNAVIASIAGRDAAWTGRVVSGNSNGRKFDTRRIARSIAP
jgi:hypothetical protein